MRRSLVIAVALLAIALLLVGGPSLLFSPSTTDVAPEEDDDPEAELVSFDGDDSGFWPYLSAREAHDKRSPINVIVRGDPDEIVRLLVEEGERDWEEIDEEEADAESETYSVVDDEGHYATGTRWGEATGTTRYAWVDPGPDEEPRWVIESLQLDDGDYYGHRTHARLYEAPNDDQWVAMQTHTEHFDWFTLRHRVDGVEAAQLAIEQEFMDLGIVDARENVTRVNLDNSGPSDADGWATLVDLTEASALLLALVAGIGARRNAIDRLDRTLGDRLTETDRRRLAAVADRVELRHLGLAGAIVGIVVGVRLAGIVLERHAGFLSMHAIAALLYPMIAVGLPVATYAIGRGITRRIDAALVAAASFAVAIWIDYGIVHVDSIPVDVVLQRMLILVALGLIAGGAAKRATRESVLNELLLVGVATWVLVLAGTLFGYL